MEVTYELCLTCLNSPFETTKELLRTWLYTQGRTTFYEPMGLLRDGEETEPVETPQIVVVSFSKDDLKTLARGIQEEFGAKVSLEFASISTSAWREGWKESFRPVETGRFLVLPPWEQGSVSDKIPIVIDPGFAFGTGQHETTRLCLCALESVAKEQSFVGLRVMDVGCGSGILTVAASKLGALDLTACDIDPDSVRASELNFAANGVSCHTFQGSLTADQHYDVVIANILKPVLLELMPAFSESVRQGGYLILSGLLKEDLTEIGPGLESAGFLLKETISEGDWVALIAQPRS